MSDALAVALRRVCGPAEAVRDWEALPDAPEGWMWRGGALERVQGAKRWTIGRRAAWDARWQMLVWEEGKARLVREGATVGEIVGWVRERAKAKNAGGGA